MHEERWTASTTTRDELCCDVYLFFSSSRINGENIQQVPNIFLPPFSSFRAIYFNINSSVDRKRFLSSSPNLKSLPQLTFISLPPLFLCNIESSRKIQMDKAKNLRYFFFVVYALDSTHFRCGGQKKGRESEEGKNK